MCNSFQKILDEFQITINDEIKHIKDFLENREEYKGKIFKEPEVHKCSNLQQFSEGVQKEGVYIFRVLNTRAIDPDVFNNVDYSSKLRNRKTTSIDAKKTFYLGKSQNLYKRLNEHLFNSSKTTYSLKMNDGNRSGFTKDLEVMIFELQSDYQNHDLIILGSIETILHKDEVPYVGSARV
jgi:hypothetical protein